MFQKQLIIIKITFFITKIKYVFKIDKEKIEFFYYINKPYFNILSKKLIIISLKF